LLIPGNHDSCERLGFASGLLRNRGVTIFARLEDCYAPVVVKGDDGFEVLVHGIPFSEPYSISRFLGRDDLLTPDLATGALCRAILERKTDGTKRPSLLLCHAFVAGSQTSESERDIYVGGSSQVDSRAFEGFAYTALGHLHKPQAMGGEHVRYSGSLLPYSKSEIGHEKAILEVTLDAKGAVQSVEPHRLKQLHALRFLEGELETLLRQGQDDPAREDYIIASLTDAGAILDARAKLRKVFPNLVHVGRAEGFAPAETPSISRLKEREAMTDLELFGAFLRESTGTEMSEAERDIVIQSLAELERRERLP
jgi:exonuclease SbcD